MQVFVSVPFPNYAYLSGILKSQLRDSKGMSCFDLVIFPFTPCLDSNSCYNLYQSVNCSMHSYKLKCLLAKRVD